MVALTRVRHVSVRILTTRRTPFKRGEIVEHARKHKVFVVRAIACVHRLESKESIAKLEIISLKKLLSLRLSYLVLVKLDFHELFVNWLEIWAVGLHHDETLACHLLETVTVQIA